MNELFNLADKLRQLREEKSDFTAMLKDINSDIDAVEKELAKEMLTAECSNFTRGDKQFVLTSTPRWSAVTERKSQLYDVLKKRGFEHLFSVNASTLAGFIKDMAEEYAAEHDGEEGLPDWLIGLVKSYDDIGITMKSATKKSK